MLTCQTRHHPLLKKMTTIHGEYYSISRLTSPRLIQSKPYKLSCALMPCSTPWRMSLTARTVQSKVVLMRALSQLKKHKRQEDLLCGMLMACREGCMTSPMFQ